VLVLGLGPIGLLSIPLWTYLARRLGNKRVFLIGGLIISVLALPLLFVSSLAGVVVVVALMGIGLIGFWVMMLPILGDVIDEASVSAGRRQEGVYMGIRTFFGRIAIIVQALTLAIVQTATGFRPGAAEQSARAVLGIRLQLALVPMVLMLTGILVFWRLYDLTPEKKQGIRARLQELGL